MMRMIRFREYLRCLATALAVVFGTSGLDLDNCRTSLGMQTQDIPDSALSASSSSDPEFGPSSSRIRGDVGAWCPNKPVSADVYEFLQIDFDELKVITLVETQGRFDHGQGQEYTEQYLLEYQREDDGRWFRFRNRRGHEIFQGNTNTYIAELRELEPVIIAKRLRFVPYSSHPKTVCLRVEVYGCQWEDGVVSYSIPQGEKRGSEVDLYDFTYDGTIGNHFLFGGLGQLTDGFEGQSNFRLDPHSLGIKGYEWVGWRNETVGPNPLELVFKFDAVRNFSAVRIHTNNMFSKEARVFNRARVYFGTEGAWTDRPLEFTYIRDPLIEYARTVKVPLGYGVGRFVKIQLYFDSKWLMISEVQFESVYADVNRTESVLPPADDDVRSSRDSIEVIGVIAKDRSPVFNGTQELLGKRILLPTEKTEVDRGSSSFVTSDPDDLGFGLVRPAHRLNDEYVGVVIGSLAALIVLLVAVFVIVYLRHRSYSCSSSDFFSVDVSKSSILVSMAPPPSSSSPPPTTTTTATTTATLSNKTSSASTKKKASVSDASSSSSAWGAGGTKNPYSTIDFTGAPGPPSESPCPAAQQQPFPGINWPVQDEYSVPKDEYSVPKDEYSAPKDEYSVLEYPKESLRPVEKLGEGRYGDVYLCEVRGHPDGRRTEGGGGGGGGVLVAVRMLNPEADDQTRMNFRKEVMTLTRMRDRNLLGLLGICTSSSAGGGGGRGGGNGCEGIVQEYMPFGDLKRYLQRHADMAETSMTKKRRSVSLLSYGCLVYLASQIASGMKFLESLSFVHRDLAARNCLVGANFLVKISDLGTSRSSFSADYYQLDDRAFLPIRWMAWEAVVLGKFSTKSDVWSFGVTLWEILSLGREQPFESLTDDQVIDNCGHVYAADGVERHLPQPIACPREFYDLMFECWQRDANQRPSFREIHMFLAQKINGYDPRDEQLEFEV